MAAPVDLELKKAFTELQAKVIDTQQKVKLADIQIEQLNRTKKHAHLTDTEIMTLVDETNMYEGVGRIFYSFMRDTEREAETQQREKQALRGEPNVGLDPGTPGPRLELKVYSSVQGSNSQSAVRETENSRRKN
ncbi:prefoldin subunit 1 isoform X1 [Vulpes vulpes]|uniref:Prefoldin subunit 1 n=1 Tax=Vulpes vulpes TaxID=9627 RepID=A0ABM4ZTJ6_VULVU